MPRPSEIDRKVADHTDPVCEVLAELHADRQEMRQLMAELRVEMAKLATGELVAREAARGAAANSHALLLAEARKYFPALVASGIFLLCLGVAIARFVL